MKVSAYVMTDGACDLYRVVQPMKMLGRNTDCMTALINLWDSIDKRAEKLDSDVIVFPRIVDTTTVQIIENFQNMAGKKIVVEYDDNLFNVSPLSPHYVDHGIEPVSIKMQGGKILPIWEDGKNIDLKANKTKMESFKKILSAADMVTVTTDILADIYKEYNSNIVVLPNCVDTDIWKSLPLKRSNENEIRLFWAGGSSHYEDWFILKDVLPAVMDKYDNVKLVLMGMKWDATLEGIPEERIEYHPWVPTPAYPYKTAILDIDIGLIPLVDSDFNSCKSSIKWLEWSSLGIPCVTSLVSPYKEMYNGENGVFIENNNPRSWYEGINLLIEDSVLRAKAGGAAKRYVEDNYDAKKNVNLWYDAYKSLLEN